MATTTASFTTAATSQNVVTILVLTPGSSMVASTTGAIVLNTELGVRKPVQAAVAGTSTVAAGITITHRLLASSFSQSAVIAAGLSRAAPIATGTAGAAAVAADMTTTAGKQLQTTVAPLPTVAANLNVTVTLNAGVYRYDTSAVYDTGLLYDTPNWAGSSTVTAALGPQQRGLAAAPAGNGTFAADFSNSKMFAAPAGTSTIATGGLPVQRGLAATVTGIGVFTANQSGDAIVNGAGVVTSDIQIAHNLVTTVAGIGGVGVQADIAAALGVAAPPVARQYGTRSIGWLRRHRRLPED